MVLNLTNTAKFPTSFKSYAYMRDANMTEAKRGITTEGVTLTFTVAWAVPAFHRTSFAVLANTKPQRSRLIKNGRNSEPAAYRIFVQKNVDAVNRTDILPCHHMLRHAEGVHSAVLEEHYSIAELGRQI